MTLLWAAIERVSCLLLRALYLVLLATEMSTAKRRKTEGSPPVEEAKRPFNGSGEGGEDGLKEHFEPGGEDDTPPAPAKLRFLAFGGQVKDAAKADWKSIDLVLISVFDCTACLLFHMARGCIAGALQESPLQDIELHVVNASAQPLQICWVNISVALCSA
jgi:hypothetical protein